MDKKTFTPLDYDQYRLYVENKESNGIWELAYKFTKFYGVNNMDYDNYPKFVEKMQHNETFFRKFMDYVWAEGPRGPKFISNYNNVLQHITCRLTTSNMYDYLSCLGHNYINIEYFFGYGFLANFLEPIPNIINLLNNI